MNRITALLASAGGVLLAACAAVGSGSGPASAGAEGVVRSGDSPFASQFTRRIDPFPVTGVDRVAFALPFLGGFNVPRPQLVDLDGDGDLDLVIQEYTGRLMVFEHASATGGVRWTYRPDLLADVDVGEWYRFVDIDADGDLDLLAEEPFSFVRLYRNRGAGRHAPDFELAADTLRDISGQPLFSDRQNIPNAADLNCDARLDLLLGRVVGTITHYRADQPMGAAIPRFEKVTDLFEGIQIVGVAGPQLPPGGGSRHGANTMALADHDGDGDLDLFWGDFFEPGLLLIENTGTCQRPDLTGDRVAFPPSAPVRTSGYNAPAFGDVDGDGDLDLLMGVLGGAFNSNATTVDNLLYFEAVRGGWELRTSRYLTQLDVGSESVPALADLDGDGDLDLMVANKIDPSELGTSFIHLFRNVGTATRPSLQADGTLALAGAYHNAPAFGDLDGDGDLDILLGTWRDQLRFFRNEGMRSAPRFVLADSAFVTLTRGSNAMPVLGDLDGDGDLDLLVGESSGTINFYRNVGSAREPRFELVSDEFGGIKVERRSAPALLDVDNDGDLDLLVGTEREGILVWRNDGGPSEPRFTPAGTLLGPLEVPAYSVPLPVDLDGDGDLDLLVGGLGGGLYYFERGPGQ